MLEKTAKEKEVLKFARAWEPQKCVKKLKFSFIFFNTLEGLDFLFLFIRKYSHFINTMNIFSTNKT